MRGVSNAVFKGNSVYMWESVGKTVEKEVKKGKDGCCLRHILNGSDDGSLSINAN